MARPGWGGARRAPRRPVRRARRAGARPELDRDPDDELRRVLAPIVASDGWVIDGTYFRKLGTQVLDAADTVVWLDLPLRIWLPRRTPRRMRGAEPLWNDNRETLRDAFGGRESLFGCALRTHFARRRSWPAQLAAYPVVRLRTQAEVEAWLARAPRVRGRSAG